VHCCYGEMVSENVDALAEVRGAVQGASVRLHELEYLGAFVSAGLRRICFCGFHMECCTCRSHLVISTMRRRILRIGGC